MKWRRKRKERWKRGKGEEEEGEEEEAALLSSLSSLQQGWTIETYQISICPHPSRSHDPDQSGLHKPRRSLRAIDYYQVKLHVFPALMRLGDSYCEEEGHVGRFPSNSNVCWAWGGDG